MIEERKRKKGREKKGGREREKKREKERERKRARIMSRHNNQPRSFIQDALALQRSSRAPATTLCTGAGTEPSPRKLPKSLLLLLL